jgi:hypothetical protein
MYKVWWRDSQSLQHGFMLFQSSYDFCKVLPCRWQTGLYKAAVIRSPTGTGKSTLLWAIINESPTLKTALMVTYRQTQASDAHGKNRDFSHYNELKQKRGRLDGGTFIEPLADRELFPHVICQVDSLPRLLIENVGAPSLDLVILDESKSIFAHLSAATFRERHTVIQLVVELLRRARRVICLEGHLVQRAFDFLTLHGITCSHALINKHASDRPLRFEFLKGAEGLQQWRNAIFEALEDGSNVLVVSMSADKGRELGAVVVERELLEDEEICIATWHSSGEVKKGLEDVNTTWKKRLVIISPTVEPGVDFNQRWFHRMFLYIYHSSSGPRPDKGPRAPSRGPLCHVLRAAGNPFAQGGAGWWRLPGGDERNVCPTSEVGAQGDVPVVRLGQSQDGAAQS